MRAASFFLCVFYRFGTFFICGQIKKALLVQRKNAQNLSKNFLLLLPNIYIFFKLIGI